MSSTDEWHLPPYRLSVADKQKLTSDAIEWINRSGYTPKIYRGLTTFPVPPEKGETAPPAAHLENQPLLLKVTRKYRPRRRHDHLQRHASYHPE